MSNSSRYLHGCLLRDQNIAYGPAALLDGCFGSTAAVDVSSKRTRWRTRTPTSPTVFSARARCGAKLDSLAGQINHGLNHSSPVAVRHCTAAPTPRRSARRPRRDHRWSDVQACAQGGRFCHSRYADLAERQKLLQPLRGPSAKRQFSIALRLEGLRRVKAREPVFHAMGRADRVAVDHLIGAGVLGDRRCRRNPMSRGDQGCGVGYYK